MISTNPLCSVLKPPTSSRAFFISRLIWILKAVTINEKENYYIILLSKFQWDIFHTLSAWMTFYDQGKYNCLCFSFINKQVTIIIFLVGNEIVCIILASSMTTYNSLVWKYFSKYYSYTALFWAHDIYVCVPVKLLKFYNLLLRPIIYTSFW